MYSVEHVEAFLRSMEDPEQVVENPTHAAILERAREAANDCAKCPENYFSVRALEEVLGDETLVVEFQDSYEKGVLAKETP